MSRACSASRLSVSRVWRSAGLSKGAQASADEFLADGFHFFRRDFLGRCAGLARGVFGDGVRIEGAEKRAGERRRRVATGGGDDLFPLRGFEFAVEPRQARGERGERVFIAATRKDDALKQLLERHAGLAVEWARPARRARDADQGPQRDVLTPGRWCSCSVRMPWGRSPGPVRPGGGAGSAARRSPRATTRAAPGGPSWSRLGGACTAGAG